MRLGTHIAGWIGRLAGLRLLALILALTLTASSVALAADVHVHAGTAIVTAEASAPVAPDSHQDEACLVCHMHCGCHIGLTSAEHERGLRSPSLRTALLPESEHRRPSAEATRLIRPPRA